MQICLVYDCLYPYTVGGAERWYRNLAERLAASGHEVTLLTRRQWEGNDVHVPGVNVVAVSPRMELYVHGRRRILPPLLFGLGVLWHLFRRGRRYDVVHTASFPYFPLLAAAAVRKRAHFRLFVDWHEVWTRAYWRKYLGQVSGWLGWRVQRACVRTPQRAFCFSRLHEQRLRAEGFSGDLTRLEGQFTGPTASAQPEPARPVAVFAGRHIPEKRVTGARPGACAGAPPDPGPSWRDLRRRAGASEGPASDCSERSRRRCRSAGLRGRRRAREGAGDCALPRPPVAS